MSKVKGKAKKLHLLSHDKNSANTNAVVAVVCPDGKENSPSSTEPALTHIELNSSFVKGLGRATVSFKITFVNNAPTAIERSRQKPIFLVFAKHIKTSDAKISGIPFSPKSEKNLQKKFRNPQFILFIATNTALSNG